MLPIKGGVVGLIMTVLTLSAVVISIQYNTIMGFIERYLRSAKER